jgi:CubicO group peptidase (beta-lactamase class C family)
MKTLFVSIMWALSASSVYCAAVTPEPQTIPELRRKVEEILLSNHVPALGIALMSREGPLWVDAIGEADVASHRPATLDTLFPLGSISKAFVGLSVLKLQEEGRVSLCDLLSIRAPEVEFSNPWEHSDPVRLIHLLEHTAGWSDNSAREARWTSAPETQRREGLQVDPRTRTSRWQPGTCFSYSNLGPDIAAYVVEKITGERFEDYVAHTWFVPLGMADSSYCEIPERTPNLAMGYLPNGEALHPHFNVLLRPSGSVAASPRGMANLVAFFLGRGSLRGTAYLPPSAIDQMETPTSTYAAAEGVKTGYGLCNCTTEWNGWVFHGHGGVAPDDSHRWELTTITLP